MAIIELRDKIMKKNNNSIKHVTYLKQLTISVRNHIYYKISLKRHLFRERFGVFRWVSSVAEDLTLK
jgi:hypothetical protein